MWWLQDYLYAAGWQVRGVLSRVQPGSFHQGHRQPVVIIPGVYENWQFMMPLIQCIHDAGHPVHVVTVLQRNKLDVPVAARMVAQHIEEAGLQDAAIVAHSKGGLIGKYLMAASLQGYRINRMIAIGTPFSGSRYARYAPIRSLRALSPNDQGLLKLSANLSVNSRIISIYSSFDPHIPGGCDLAGATNIKLPTLGHFRLLSDARLHAAVLKHLGHG